MVIRICDDGGATLYLFNSSDVAGVIAAVKECDNVVFNKEFYKYDYMTFNHYTDEDKQVNQELIIYVNPITSNK